MVAINVALGSGADTQAMTGKIAIRPVAEHKVGEFLALSAWDDHALSVEPIQWNLAAGQLYEVREIEPRGKRRVFQAPDATTNYADLVWLTEVPSSDGGYVIEPTVAEYDGATGEPDIAVGDYWIATNEAHPDYGYLMQKGS
jgi:hypothetical protein